MSFGFLAFEPAAGAGDGHALAGTHLEQVGLEFGEHREHGEEHLGHRVAGAVDVPAEGQADAPGGQGIADVAGVRDRAGEPVQLGDHQGVVGAHGRQRMVHAGPGAAGAGESLVEVDPVCGDTEAGEDLGLGGEVLQDGRAPGVADQFSHPASYRLASRQSRFSPDHLYETALPQAGGLGGRTTGCLAGGSPTGHQTCPRLPIRPSSALRMTGLGHPRASRLIPVAGEPARSDGGKCLVSPPQLPGTAARCGKLR